MKNILSLLLILSVLTAKSQFTAQNITLLSRWNDNSVVAEPTYGIKYSGCWGWHDGKGNEYALLGSTAGVYFIDVTDPKNPVTRDYVAGRRNGCIWREIKTYQNYAYLVSDDISPNSMQIVDLSYLPDSVHIVYDSDTSIQRSHTIWVDGDKLYSGITNNNLGFVAKMSVWSLQNPERPTLLRKLDDDNPNTDWVHDMYVRNDTVFASSSYSGLFIYKYNATSNRFTTLGSLTNYVGQGYNHSSVLTPDGKTLVFTDEVPVNLPAKILDITDMGNLQVTDTFYSSTTATAHNPFLFGNSRLVMAYYQDGVQIFDISNPSNVTRTGFLDTNPTDGAGLPEPAYSGCWGAYTELPSGNIFASDMQNGLFIMDASAALFPVGIEEASSYIKAMSIFPNPSAGDFTVSLGLLQNSNIEWELLDTNGKLAARSNAALWLTGDYNNFKVNTSNLGAGMYHLKIITNDQVLNRKIIIEK